MADYVQSSSVRKQYFIRARHSTDTTEAPHNHLSVLFVAFDSNLDDCVHDPTELPSRTDCVFLNCC